jgi:hypothetical protein
VSWIEVEVSLVGRTGGLPVTVPVDETEVLDVEEDVIEDVSVLTTVVVCVLFPVEDAETVKVWVITVVTTRDGFITHLTISAYEFRNWRKNSPNSSTDVVRDATSGALIIIASGIWRTTRRDRSPADFPVWTTAN